MDRIDRISLLFVASTILMLAGMALSIPAEPRGFGLASICRSRADAAASKPASTQAALDRARTRTQSTP